MPPSGSTEVPLAEDENIALKHPPYLPPVRPGVQPPWRINKFTLRTPSLPPGVQLVGTMTWKVDRLKYVDHDTNDHGKFPQFAPGTYLHSIHYPKTGATLLEAKQWAAGLDRAGLLKMLNVPHFGRSTQVTMVVKQLLVLVHDGNLWIGNERIPINGELVNKITGFPEEGPNPRIEFVGKHKDMKLA